MQFLLSDLSLREATQKARRCVEVKDERSRANRVANKVVEGEVGRAGVALISGRAVEAGVRAYSASVIDDNGVLSRTFDEASVGIEVCAISTREAVCAGGTVAAVVDAFLAKIEFAVVSEWTGCETTIIEERVCILARSAIS